MTQLTAKRPGKRIKNRAPTARKDYMTAYIMVIPPLIILGIFVFWPLFESITKSLTDWNFYNSTYVGFKNYLVALRHPYFRKAFSNIVKYVLISVPMGIVFPFLFAHCVRHMRGLYADISKTVLYIPSIISGVIASVIFLFIFDFQGGLINNMIRTLGGTRYNFMAHGTSAMLAIIFTSFWSGFGHSTLYMLAGLNNIPDSYYEAAALDGCGGFKRMIYVTIPCMRNIFLLNLVNGIRGTLMMMELPMLMTNGGPNNATLTPVLYIYNCFNDTATSMGYVLACSVMMMIFSVAFTATSFFLIKPDKSME